MNITLTDNGWNFVNLSKYEWELIVAAVFYSEDIGGKGYPALAAKIRQQIEEAEDDIKKED